MKQTLIFKPQAGPQTAFLASNADFVIYGGAVGGGKSYGLLLDLARYLRFPQVNALILRLQTEDFNNPGSIWMDSQNIYPHLGLTPNLADYSYRLPQNGKLKFGGFKDEKKIKKYIGSSYSYIGIDEGQYISASKFWKLQGRLRSAVNKFTPCIRLTCNPERDCWIRDFIDWWLDKDGYPIPERAGVIRYFTRPNEIVKWFDDEKSVNLWLKSAYPDKTIFPTSFTFIPATLEDNQILLDNDPAYYTRVLSDDDAENKLKGCWNFQAAGKLFKAAWFKKFVLPPREPEIVFITTDTASSTNTANDYTVFQCWMRSEGKVYLIDQKRDKYDASEQLPILTAMILEHKAKYVSIERAATGFYLIEQIRKQTGVLVIEQTRKVDKYKRGYEVQPYLEEGYVYLNQNAPYYGEFLSEIVGFSPENKTKTHIHDDQVDCMIDAINIAFVKKIGYHDIRKAQQSKPLKRHTTQVNHI